MDSRKSPSKVAQATIFLGLLESLIALTYHSWLLFASWVSWNCFVIWLLTSPDQPICCMYLRPKGDGLSSPGRLSTAQIYRCIRFGGRRKWRGTAKEFTHKGTHNYSIHISGTMLWIWPRQKRFHIDHWCWVPNLTFNTWWQLDRFFFRWINAF